MKFNPRKEFKEMSRILETYFGYVLRWRVIPKSPGKIYIVELIDPNYYRQALCSKVGWNPSNTLRMLYKHMSGEVIYDHNGKQIMLPSFETARELKMKLSLMGK